VSLTVIVTCTTVTVGLILQFETIALNMTWLTTIISISVITRMFLTLVVVSAVLTAILVDDDSNLFFNLSQAILAFSTAKSLFLIYNNILCIKCWKLRINLTIVFGGSWA
jgi:hypothetical protein